MIAYYALFCRTYDFLHYYLSDMEQQITYAAFTSSTRFFYALRTRYLLRAAFACIGCRTAFSPRFWHCTVALTRCLLSRILRAYHCHTTPLSALDLRSALYCYAVGFI